MKKTIHIQGMHCVSCEMIIQQTSEAIDGVKVEYISAKKGVMHLEVADPKVMPEIEKAIRDAGYTIVEGKAPEAEQPHLHRYNFDRLIVSIVIVGLLATIFYKLDVMQYLPSVGDKLSYGVALLMGLVASVSTCLAIVGSIVI